MSIGREIDIWYRISPVAVSEFETDGDDGSYVTYRTDGRKNCRHAERRQANQGVT
jgi:hypothetical protein